MNTFTSVIRVASAVGISLVFAGVAGGQFLAVHSEVSDPEFREWQVELQQARELESLADELNAALTIPGEVILTAAECGTSNAFYYAEERTIAICYELMREFYYGAMELGFSEEEAEAATANATAFFFYHELGHALVHVLGLPITGLEEDAVDQLSMYALAQDSAAGEEPALDAALAFLAWSEEEAAAGVELAVWDEHSLNAQRFYNILCWVYGRNPEAHGNLVRDGHLPEDRAARCPHEWEQIDRSWSSLLAANLKG